MEKEKRKKQKVLMPAGIRSKLMAAASMLMVGVIMMVSSTYAWFTLSTAPEVKNISTTVAGNGSLEIALMPKEGTIGTIKKGAVGSDTAVNKNTSWGSVVDLSDNSYGLDEISLNPAKLNVDTDGKTLVSKTKLLSIADYGYDGRITTVKADKIGVKSRGDADAFVKDEYGVRAIGELEEVTAGGTEKVGSAYGYVVDLALRINTNGTTEKPATLKLQTEAVNRIYADSDNAETMGRGSTMTFEVPNGAGLKAGALKELLNAIRITFVENLVSSAGNSQILGTARLDTNEISDYTDGKNVSDGVNESAVTTSGTAPIYLYTQDDNNKWEKDKAGVLVENMVKNEAKQISVIVWLDGTAVKNANISATAQSLTASLNLQFSTDAELIPAVNTPLKGE